MEQWAAQAMKYLVENWQVVVGVAILLLIGSGLFQDLRSRETILQGKLDGMKDSLQQEMINVCTLTEEQGERDREVFQVGLYNFNESVTRVMGDMSRTQQGQFDAFGAQLRAANLVTEEQVQSLHGKLDERMDQFTNVLNESMGEQGQSLEVVAQKLDQTFRRNEERFDTLQHTLARGLMQMRARNQDQMNQLKIQPDRRMLESCMRVSERLDQLKTGLSELQSMIDGAMDMRKMVEALKHGDAWSEVGMQDLLRRALLPSQYRTGIPVRPQSLEPADYVIQLPSRAAEGERFVYLPIDTKFPVEENLRLMQALEYMDPDEVETATKALELALRVQAKRMREAFVDPPFTTEYAILYLNNEGLYAQMMQNRALRGQLQQQYRVLLAGPATMASLLASLQCGLRAHAIERQARDLRDVLNEASEQMESLTDMISGTSNWGEIERAPLSSPVQSPDRVPEEETKSVAASSQAPMTEAQRLLEIERRRFQQLYGEQPAAPESASAVPIELEAQVGFEEDLQDPPEDDDWD